MKSKKEFEKTAKKLLKELVKAQIKLNGFEGEMASFISPLTDVEEISILYQSSDGFVICDSDSNNAPLDKCIGVIIEKGFLSKEDFEELSI